MRLFVAVDLSDDAREAIVVEQRRLAAALVGFRDSLRLVKANQLHLTLLFLGEVAEARVPDLVATMNVALDLPAFQLGLGGAGVFPPRGAPRVLWIGVTEGAASLVRLQRSIVERVRQLAIACDDRPFHPHLTIGRWRGSGSGRRVRDRVARPISFRADAMMASLSVTRATLYQSRLSSDGSTYTALAHATLSATP